MVNEQFAATDALIRFLEEHDCHVPDALRASRDAFAKGDTETACRFAFAVRPFGMGSLTDGYPKAKQGEDQSYCRVVFESLVRNWCFWISVADDRENKCWKRVIRAIGSFLK